MRPDLWPRVTELVQGALEVPDSERGAWIEAQSNGDRELAAEVVRLVEAHRGAGRFLDDPLIAQPGAAEVLREALATGGGVEPGRLGPASSPAAPPPAILSPGQRIGPFVVLDCLGAGGMGEVWRAQDPSLGRDVAIKVLPAAYSADAERLRRFEQEARTAGQLNHPNILTVHAVGSEGGQPYLVTELLEGETLQQRLSTGALPPRKAIDLAIQIALGLGAAHERGIVHRDLKPANLFVTTDGRLKILDFGLAKLRDPSGSAGNQVSSASGVMLGTAGYMAPEQVRGQEVDQRADLFSLGVVLYEMLAGRRAFQAASAVESMNQILTAEPHPLEGIDPALVRIVQHCLEKKPGERFQSARDLAFHLEDARPSSDAAISIGRSGTPSRPGVRAHVRRWLPWAVTAAMLVVAGAIVRPWYGGLTDSPRGPVRQFALSMAATPLSVGEWPPLAISPDGRRLAFVTRGEAGVRIVVRDLETLTERVIPGTDDGFSPFFSPDGEHLGFFTSTGLSRVAIAGGPPLRLAATSPVSRGAVWAIDGTIYFAYSSTLGIFRIAADGGAVEAVTTLDTASGDHGHLWPDVAPDGAYLVYVSRRGDTFDDARVVARSLRSATERTIVEGGTYARVAPDGRIVFARGETLHVLELDPDTLTARGPPRPVIRGVQMDPLMGGSYYAVARDGTLAYAPGDARPPGRTLLWVTPAGAETPAFPDERTFLYPTISPDGRSVAVTIEGSNQDIWRFEIGRPVLARLTSLPSEDFGAVWSPDGRRLAYTSVRQGRDPAVFVKSADTADGETLILEPGFPNAWTPDAEGLVVTTERFEGGRKSVAIAMAGIGGGPMPPIEGSRYDRYGPTLSPDGRHLAFVSLEAGQPEVFVGRRDAAAARQASVGGGTSPVWERDGRQLFYRNRDAVMSVAVGADVGPSLSPPRRLFGGQFVEPARPDWPRNYDVAPDGRFLMIRQTYTPAVSELVVVLGWRGQSLIGRPD
jgi:Tol biopolymer transport system component